MQDDFGYDIFSGFGGMPLETLWRQIYFFTGAVSGGPHVEPTDNPI
ncbi:hypothetical protein G3N57_00785 [Paraburkholderia sp. Se-20369]|nr:hypothetical protein [Paraburkholderia sp. Se-20369]